LPALTHASFLTYEIRVHLKTGVWNKRHRAPSDCLCQLRPGPLLLLAEYMVTPRLSHAHGTTRPP